MFNSLSGRISGHEFPTLYLSSGSVEWALEVSAATFQQALAAATDEELRLFVHLHVREDLLKLFGFATRAERTAFLELMTVSGIGPRQALKILSATTVEALGTMLEGEDVASLTRLPGLGTRTAQKMILQLRGRLVTREEGSETADAGGGPHAELVAALVEMGFDGGAAQRTVEGVAAEIGDSLDAGETTEREIFRRSIVALSGG